MSDGDMILWVTIAALFVFAARCQWRVWRLEDQLAEQRDAALVIFNTMRDRP